MNDDRKSKRRQNISKKRKEKTFFDDDNFIVKKLNKQFKIKKKELLEDEDENYDSEWNKDR